MYPSHVMMALLEARCEYVLKEMGVCLPPARVASSCRNPESRDYNFGTAKPSKRRMSRPRRLSSWNVVFMFLVLSTK